MRAEELALVQGWDDTRRALDRWNRNPFGVLAPWTLGALAVAALLLTTVWLVATVSTPDPTRGYFPGVYSPATLGDLGFLGLWPEHNRDSPLTQKRFVQWRIQAVGNQCRTRVDFANAINNRERQPSRRVHGQIKRDAISTNNSVSRELFAGEIEQRNLVTVAAKPGGG